MPRKKPAPSFTLDDVLTACLLDLETRNMSPETRKMYADNVAWFSVWLTETGRPLSISAVTREDVQGYLRAILKKNAAMTVDLRFHQLRAFFNWAVKNDWLDTSPMQGMDRPKIPSTPKNLFSDELAALLETCKGATLEDVRDLAMLRLFIGTGARLGEVTALCVKDVDLPNRVVRLTGKTGTRRARLGAKVAAALHKYLLLRRQHPHATAAGLWLGRHGALTRIGVIQVVKRRAKSAGVEANPHKFRHTWAAAFRRAGGSVVDLETLGGWSPNSPMTRHYAAVALAEEALQHADTLGIGEDI